MRRQQLADETLDGIMYGWRLASSPVVKARNEAYTAALARDRDMLAALPVSVLEKAISERRLWTMPGVMKQRSTAEKVEAIARCMQGKDRPLWLAALQP